MISLKNLKEACGSPKKEDPWREKLARKISIRITWMLLKVYPKISPNKVTISMLSFGLLSAFLFMPGKYSFSLMGIIAYHLYLILDACDGEIARYKKSKFEESKKGIYLDYLGHIILNPLIIMSIAIGAYFQDPGFIQRSWFLIIGFITMYFMFINNFIKLKVYEMVIDSGEIKELAKTQKEFKSQDRRKNPIMDELWQFFRIMTFNSLLFFGIFNLLPYLVLINGIIFPIQSLKRFYGVIRKK